MKKKDSIENQKLKLEYFYNNNMKSSLINKRKITSYLENATLSQFFEIYPFLKNKNCIIKRNNFEKTKKIKFSSNNELEFIFNEDNKISFKIDEIKDIIETKKNNYIRNKIYTTKESEKEYLIEKEEENIKTSFLEFPKGNQFRYLLFDTYIEIFNQIKKNKLYYKSFVAKYGKLNFKKKKLQEGNDIYTFFKWKFNNKEYKINDTKIIDLLYSFVKNFTSIPLYNIDEKEPFIGNYDNIKIFLQEEKHNINNFDFELT